MPEGYYDHTPMVLRMYPDIQQKKPFRFKNMWCNHEALIDTVTQAWVQPILGCAMYRVMQRLKVVKVALKLMNREGFGDVEANLVKVSHELTKVQEEMHKDVGNFELITREKGAQENLLRAKKNQPTFLHQKSKLTWLKCGDENTKMFYQALKHKRYHNRVNAI